MQHDILFAFRKAHEIIWKHGYWKYLLIPILLSGLLALLMFGGFLLSSTAISHAVYPHLESRFAVAEWTKHVLIVLLYLTHLGPAYILFRSLVLVCYGPFLDRISVKAEELINGHSGEADSGFWESLKRPILMTFYSVSAVLGIGIGGFVLGLVPLVGVLLAGAFTFPANLFVSSMSYLDPYLERAGYPPKKAFALMWENAFSLIVFGFTGLLITMLPLVGWFVGPTYSVVAGVVLSIVLHNRKRQEGEN